MAPLHEHNRAKIRELQEFAQNPCLQWVGECFRLEKPFVIGEVFRSQKRQNQLYLIGRRGIPGERQVTWTRNSVHTQRLALDLDPVTPMTAVQWRIRLAEIAEIGRKYGIVRPEATLRVGDFRHFELHTARVWFPTLSIDEQKKKASAHIWTLSGNIKERALARYRATYGEEPV